MDTAEIVFDGAAGTGTAAVDNGGNLLRRYNKLDDEDDNLVLGCSSRKFPNHPSFPFLFQPFPGPLHGLGLRKGP